MIEPMRSLTVTPAVVLALLAGAPLQSQPTARGATALKGLYLRAVPVSGGLFHEHYYFWADGRVCRVLPKGGLDAVDFAALQREHPSGCGRYAVRGSQITFSLGTEQPFTWSFKRFDGTNFELDQYPAVRVDAFRPGQRLEGTWTGTEVTSRTRKHTVTFRSDGTFDWLDEPVTRLDGTPARLAGTYQLAGNTLVLNGNLRRTIYIVNDGRGTTFNVEGTTLSKER